MAAHIGGQANRSVEEGRECSMAHLVNKDSQEVINKDEAATGTYELYKQSKQGTITENRQFRMDDVNAIS